MDRRVQQRIKQPRVRPAEGWAPSECTLPLSHHERNQQPYHTGSVAARVNKDRTFRCTPGRKCQVCYWCIIGRDISIGRWNTRTLRAAWKLQELTREMDRCKWNVLGLCEMRWKNFGERTTEEGQSSVEKRINTSMALDFFVHIVNTVIGCCPVSSRLITIHLRKDPLNITVVQAYVQLSDYDDNEREKFYDRLQNVIENKAWITEIRKK